MTTLKLIVAIIITLIITNIGDKNKMAGLTYQTTSNGLSGGLIPITPLSTTTNGYTGGSSAGVTSLTPYSQSGLTYPSGGWIPEDGSYPQQTLGASTTTNTTNNTPTIDPYAKYGGRAAYDSMRSGFGVQKQGILDSIGSWGDNTATKYASGITDLIQNYRNSQDALNRQSVTNEVQRLQGTQGILGALGRGVKSGMTMLGNRNAGSSSAAGEIARAYGDIARRDQSGVNNQYAAGNEDIAIQQNLLGQDMGTQQRKFKENMDMEINSKVEEARNALSALDAQIAGASLPDRIAIDQEKQNIKNQLIAKLQGYDQQLATGIQGIAPASREQNLATAQQRLAAGQVPETAFAFTDQIPAQFQNTGGQASGLPLFTLNNKRRQTA